MFVILNDFIVQLQMASDKILILGSGGQIGTELVTALRNIYGNDNVIASDIKPITPKHSRPKEGSQPSPEEQVGQEKNAVEGPYEIIDVIDPDRIFEVVFKYKITQVYLLAAMLSATSEQNPEKAWHLNMESLFHVLDLAKEKRIERIYWPSSIAVFGSTTPKEEAAQHTVTEPSTVYGISKLAGERWCEWYYKKYNVDVRSLRYPGLISYTTPPGGGTTDYAVDIFHRALKTGNYECFLSAGTRLPMMYMPDAIRATMEIMQAPADQIKIRSSYNIGAFDFTPSEIGHEIRQHIQDFQVTYKPDFRQQIADSWPQSIDDRKAKEDWGWKPEFNLRSMVEDMLENMRVLK